MISLKAIPLRHIASQYRIELGIVHVCSDFGLTYEGLGHVVKAGRKWEARVAVVFRSYTARVTLTGFRTMREALDAFQTQVSVFVAERIAHQVNKAYDLAYDEIKAHAVQDAITQAQAKADLEAPEVLSGTGSEHGLVIPLATLRALVGSNDMLAEELKSLRYYLRCSRELNLSIIREYAYTCRIIEHELIRRGEVEQEYANAEL